MCCSLQVLANTKYVSSTTLHFQAPKAPFKGVAGFYNGSGRGLISSVFVATEACPSHAPNSQALVSALVVGARGPLKDEQLQTSVQEELLEWFGPCVSSWAHLRTYHNACHLPLQTPGAAQLPAGPLGQGLYLCGDHTQCMASIEGALVSARVTAEAVIAAVKAKV